MHKEVIIRALKRSTWPQCQLAISLRDQTLVRCDKAPMLSRGTWPVYRYDLASTCSDLGSSTIWRKLVEMLGANLHGTLYGWHMYDILCRCGLYGAIETGQLSLAYGHADYASRFRGASLVTENPPTIVDLNVGAGRRITCVDLHNYGISPARETEIYPGDQLAATVIAVTRLTDTLRSCDTGGLRNTSAATGWAAYRRHHMADQLVAHTHPEARKLERHSYYSGRVECFRIGQIPGHVYHLDVRSMYLSIGMTFRFPTRLCRYISAQEMPAKFEGKSTVMFGADVTLETHVPAYPVRHNGVVIYPLGQFRTRLAPPELAVAQDAGQVQFVHAITMYDSESVWRKFSAHWLAQLAGLRTPGKAWLRGAIKHMVNCTFGRIGSRGKEWITVTDRRATKRWDYWLERHPVNGTVVPWRTVDGVTQYLDAAGEPPTSLPIVSATMNSYGRMLLYQILAQARMCGQVYYCDTDGIMCDQAARDGLDRAGYIGDSPGKLTLREESADVHIYGAKHYRFGERICAAGVPDEATYSADGRASWDRTEGWTTGLRHKYSFGPRMYAQARSRPRAYRHGVVHEDGRVSPYVMEYNAKSEKNLIIS